MQLYSFGFGRCDSHIKLILVCFCCSRCLCCYCCCCCWADQSVERFFRLYQVSSKSNLPETHRQHLYSLVNGISINIYLEYYPYNNVRIAYGLNSLPTTLSLISILYRNWCAYMHVLHLAEMLFRIFSAILLFLRIFVLLSYQLSP